MSPGQVNAAPDREAGRNSALRPERTSPQHSPARHRWQRGRALTRRSQDLEQMKERKPQACADGPQKKIQPGTSSSQHCGQGDQGLTANLRTNWFTRSSTHFHTLTAIHTLGSACTRRSPPPPRSYRNRHMRVLHKSTETGESRGGRVQSRTGCQTRHRPKWA